MERRTIAKEDIANLKQAMNALSEAYFLLYSKTNQPTLSEYYRAYRLCVSDNSKDIMKKYFSENKNEQMGKIRSNIIRASKHKYDSDTYNELLQEIEEDFDIIILDLVTHCHTYHEDNKNLVSA